jgi:two-component system cell cycle response regulator DivK
MKRILVVENDRISRELAQRALSAGGYEVVCARDGEEALLLAPDVSPDVVLMDVGLPGIDGIEAAQVLHEDPKTAAIPIVVWSALVFSWDIDRAKNAGCADYLTKPLGARALIDRIDGVLGVVRQTSPTS